MLLKNLYNVVPIHESASDWYENKKTYHGVDRYPLVPVGKILPTFLYMTNGDVYVMNGKADIQLYDALTGDAVGKVIEAEVVQYGRDTKPLYIKGMQLVGQKEGVYYYTLKGNDGKEFVSEPFRWVNDEGLIHIRYRRSTRIDAGGVRIEFPTGMYFDMYVRSEIMMPEYQYDSEVEELDGYVFVRKKVSYKKHRFTFLCTDYMAEAVRLIWHCNDVVIEQHGEEYKVDYMDAPDPSWKADNHLMQMDITFRTDTIMQTNGESDENSGVEMLSYDGSFDASFN